MGIGLWMKGYLHGGFPLGADGRGSGTSSLGQASFERYYQQCGRVSVYVVMADVVYACSAGPMFVLFFMCIYEAPGSFVAPGCLLSDTI